MKSNPLVVTETPQIHAMMIVSGVSAALVSKEQSKNLRGTLTDKINVENFCYNYQNYVLHSTVQFSESDALRVKRPPDRPKRSLAPDLNSIKPAGFSRQNSFKTLLDPVPLPSVVSRRAGSPRSNRFSGAFFAREEEQRFQTKETMPNIDVYLDPKDRDDKELIRAALRQKAIRRLEKFFERGVNEHCLLFLSGHGLSKATFVINDSIGAHLTLEDILKAWDKQETSEWLVTDRHGRPKVTRRHLLIVIDACNSGSFTSMLQKEYRRPLKDVSIQTSSSINEKSYDDVLGGGGYFLNNLLYINGLKDIRYNYSYRNHDSDKKERRDWQIPTFYSELPELEAVFRLRIGFHNWEELEWRVNTCLIGTFIGENGDILKGEFKSIQLHGPGEKRLANGRVEVGVFRNDQLDGAGQVRWNNFECSGKFDRGRLAELYSARLSNGLELSMLDRDAVAAKKYSVVIQDDKIQEITKLNETDQCSSLFEWVVTRYANSDTNLSIFKDGIRHGNCFHLRKDGGVILSQFKNGVRHFSYSADESGRVEVTAIEFWDISKKEKRPESEAVPTKSGQKKDELMKMFEGKIDRLVPEKSKEFWQATTYPDKTNLKLLVNGKFVYEGDTNKDRQPEGSGKLIDDRGNTYEGSWKDGRPDGKGSYRSADGRVTYEGFWSKGLRNGIGKMVWEGGDVYMGSWKQDLVCGWGVMRCANWVTYEGFMMQVRTGPFLCKVWPNNLDIKDKYYYRPENTLYLFGTEQRGAYPPLVPPKEAQLGAKPAAAVDLRPYDFKELSRESFYGEIKRGERSGYGKISTPEGVAIEGEFFEDMLVVENQKVILEDESKYEGSCLMRLVTDGNFSGTRLVYKDRFAFEGPHMKGKVTKKDGSVYEGDFVTKKRHGKGRLTMKDGTIYEGGFSHDMFSGYGRYTTPDGRVLEGQFFDGMLMVHGYTYTFTNGDKYIGSCLMRLRPPREGAESKEPEDWLVFKEMHGRGVLTKAQGDVYEGKFFRNKKHGNGILYIEAEKDGRSDYSQAKEGQFFKDFFWIKNSSTTFMLPNGTKYTGDFLARRRTSNDPSDQFVWEDIWYFHAVHGRGMSVEPDGTIYEGEFEEGQKSDRGKLITPDNEVYEGMFACEWKDPYGKYTFANGDQYQGEYEFGEISGKGTYILATGDVYEGVCKGEKIRLFMEDVQGKDGSTYTGWCWTERVKGSEEPDGNSIRGHWKFVSRDGFGTYRRADGAVFTGYFIKNLKNGLGQLVFANGAAYRGHFSENRFDGFGKYVRQDGSYLLGTFKAGGFRVGTVNLVFEDGARITSEWDREGLQENALVVFPDGDILKVAKNPEIRDWLLRLMKSFPDWPSSLVLPPPKKGLQLSSKGFYRAETLGHDKPEDSQHESRSILSMQEKRDNEFASAVAEVLSQRRRNRLRETRVEIGDTTLDLEARMGESAHQPRVTGHSHTNTGQEVDNEINSEDTIERVSQLRSEIRSEHKSSAFSRSIDVFRQRVGGDRELPGLTQPPRKETSKTPDGVYGAPASFAAVKRLTFPRPDAPAEDERHSASARSSLSKQSESKPRQTRLLLPRADDYGAGSRSAGKNRSVFDAPRRSGLSVFATEKPNTSKRSISPVPSPRESHKPIKLSIPKPEELRPSVSSGNLHAHQPVPTNGEPHRRMDSRGAESHRPNELTIEVNKNFLPRSTEPIAVKGTLTALKESLPVIKAAERLSVAHNNTSLKDLSNNGNEPAETTRPKISVPRSEQVTMTRESSGTQQENRATPKALPTLSEPTLLLPSVSRTDPITPKTPRLESQPSKNQMSSFQLINTMKEEDASPKPISAKGEGIPEDNFPELVPVSPMSPGPVAAQVASGKPPQNLEQMIAKKQVLAELEKAEEFRKHSTVLLEPKVEEPFSKTYTQLGLSSGLEVDRTTSDIRRRGSTNVLGQISHTRNPSGPVNLATMGSETPTTPGRGSMAISSLRDPLPAVTEAEPQKVESARSLVGTQSFRKESDGPSPVMDKVRQSVTAKLKFMLKKTIQDPQTPKDSDQSLPDPSPRIERLSKAESKISGKELRKVSTDNEPGKETTGPIRLKDGGVYEGQIDKGCMHGLGTLTLPDGSVYKGRFFKNLFHGSGELSRPGQALLIGYFVPMNEAGSQYKVTLANGEVVAIEF